MADVVVAQVQDSQLAKPLQVLDGLQLIVTQIQDFYIGHQLLKTDKT